MKNRILKEKVCLAAAGFSMLCSALSGCMGISPREQRETVGHTVDQVQSAHARDAPADGEVSGAGPLIEELSTEGSVRFKNVWEQREHADVILPDSYSEFSCTEISRDELREELLDQLLDRSEAAVSHEEVAAAAAEHISKMKQTADALGLSYEEYLSEESILSPQDYEASLHEIIEKKLKRQKILEAFAIEEHVDLSEAAWETFLEREAADYGYDNTEDFCSDMELIGMDTQLKAQFLEKQVGDDLIAAIRKYDVPAE